MTAPTVATRPMSAPTGENLIEIRFPAKPDRLKLVREIIRGAAQVTGCTHDCTEDIVIAINEACMNIIQHGYRGAPDGAIILEVWHDRDELTFRLVDFADPIDPASVKARNLEDVRPGGLGLHLISQVMDDTAFLQPPDGAGNVLQMVKRIA